MLGEGEKLDILSLPGLVFSTGAKEGLHQMVICQIPKHYQFRAKYFWADAQD
jgi:hypothetical protein